MELESEQHNFKCTVTHFASLSSRPRDGTKNSVASTTHGKTSDELVAERLALSNGAQAKVGDLLGVELKRRITHYGERRTQETNVL